jgi:hypothetical protein
MPPICEARRENDEMVCHRCKLAWDVKDPEPPRCSTAEPPDRDSIAHENGIAQLRRILEN